MQIGVIVNNLNDSQLAYESIKSCNQLLHDVNFDVSIFYEDISPFIIRPSFGVFNATELFNFKGTAISTSLSSASMLLKTLIPERKIFYVWDLEWVRHNKNYLLNIETYQNEDLELVTPSNEYQQELLNYCGRDSRVVKDFNLKEIVCKNQL